MKKGLNKTVHSINLRLKFLLMFKCVFLVSLVFCLRVSALSYSQDKKVTMNIKDMALEKALSLLEEKGDIRLLYSGQTLPADKTVTLSVKNEPVLDVLSQLLQNTNLQFKVFSKELVTISPASEAPETIQIRGKVTDEKGEPLPGASVKINGTTGGTMTDANGDYQLNAPDNGTLVVSFVGYITQNIQINGRTTVNISLKPSSINNLNEVVVIGYGDQVKKNLSTSIASVKAADVNELPVGTLNDALAGKAAGVDVTASSGGQPGVAPDITIRGLGSLGSNNSPLYVVDGYPLESADQFAAINPADVASIDILKDAASASIYGSRASNGVVIVTTKRGRAGKARFNFSTYTGVQQLSHKIALMDSAEFVHQEGILNTQRKGKLVLTGPDLGNTDWQDEMYHNAWMTTANLTATGGTDNVQYNVSGSYLDQDGVEITSSFKRYGLRLNFDANLSKKLKIGFNMSPNYSIQYSVPNGGNFTATNDNSYGSSGAIPNVIYSALLMAPIIPAYMPDGRYGQPDFLPASYNWSAVNVLNPVAVLNSVSNIYKNFQMLGNAYVQWDIIKGLTYKLNAGGNVAADVNNAYVSSVTPTQFATLASFLNPNPNSIYAGESTFSSIAWLAENTLTYNHTFNNKHHINVLLLQSAQKFSSTKDLVSGTTGTYTTDQIQNPSASALTVGSVSYDLYTYLSYAARLNYDYKGKYLFSSSIRQDGSSKFGANNRFGTFRSVSGAWRLAEERFIQKIDWISELKLRVSYGETGNANIGSFTWLNSIVTGNYNFGASGTATGIRNFGTNPSGYYNPDLTWEKNHQLDLGFELGLFKDRIYFTADLYRKETFDMIQSKTLLGDVGYAQTYKTNTGDLLNQGLELALTTINLRDPKGFNWTTNFNISFNRNKVLDLGGPQSLTPSAAITGWSNVFQIMVGRPIGDIYGYKVNGVLHNAAEVAAAPKFDSYAAQPGDMKFVDINGDGVISVADRTVIGSTLPKFTAGMTNSFRYKDFDLSFVLAGRYGSSIINGNLRNAFGSAGFNMPKQYLDNMWVTTDPEANVRYPNVSLSGAYSFVSALTTLAVENGSYLRMRNITAGYTFKPALLRRLGLQTLRVYVSGQNVITITKYTGYNPEASVNGNTVINPGVDQGVYPSTRNFVAGINVGF